MHRATVQIWRPKIAAEKFLVAMSILLIDSYDSFTYNLRDLIAESIPGVHIYTLHNDSVSAEQLMALEPAINRCIDCIIIGPGPGNPNNDADIGIIKSLVHSSVFASIPILGICLGFQAIAMDCGYQIKRLANIKHGQVLEIAFKQDILFDGCHQNFSSVRYHSLGAYRSGQCGLDELAYTNDSEKVLMAGKHATKPFYGVQYHPESACSENGSLLIKNFWRFASSWNAGRPLVHAIDEELSRHFVATNRRLDTETDCDVNSADIGVHESIAVQYRQVVSSKSTIDMCNLFREKHEIFLLNSLADPGVWSIIGIPIEQQSIEITWSVSKPAVVRLNKWKSTELEEVPIVSIWSYLNEFMEKRFVLNSEVSKKLQLPFMGGLMGFFSYESGQFVQARNTTRPDIKLIFIERCVLTHKKTNLTTVLSIKENDSDWINSSLALLKQTPVSTVQDKLAPSNIIKPSKENYIEKFNKSQTYLNNGDSYELCLCCQTKFSLPRATDPWLIYTALAKKNPSPYSGYFHFQDSVLVSSSPERFLSWQNDYTTANSRDYNKLCQLRPIKGTVKKTPGLDYSAVEDILNSPKEKGENLMIVDLIRHDLYSHGENVIDNKVLQLMKIEEYSTVYQLVSVIECTIPNRKTNGFDILSTSLPPGSMTGAPKKRSVEILQSELETLDRGIYSGVFGYWSIDDQADWSVVIRSFFSYLEGLETLEKQDWYVGAGGAITILSTAEGEWQEMNAKLESILQVFD